MKKLRGLATVALFWSIFGVCIWKPETVFYILFILSVILLSLVISWFVYMIGSGEF